MDERAFSTSIPELECEIYYLCVQQAIDLAETGEVLAGRWCPTRTSRTRLRVDG